MYFCWAGLSKGWNEVFHSYWLLLRGGILAAPGALKILLFVFWAAEQWDSVRETMSGWQMLLKTLTTKANKSGNPRTSVCCFSWKLKAGKDPKTGKKRGRREHQLQKNSPMSSIFFLLRTRDKAWALLSQSKDEEETLAIFCLLALQSPRQDQE